MHCPKPPQRDNKDVSIKDNLSGYQAKVNLLKQIDDAASQFGGASNKTQNTRNRLNESRQTDAKRTAAMVLSKPGAGSKLQGSDLDSLDRFNHNRTLLGTKNDSLIYTQPDFKQDGPQSGTDLRSLKSEYDYTHKKKFVDVLGNMKKSNGLKGLQSDKKSLADNASRRSQLSKNSIATSLSRRMNSKAQDQAVPIEPIKEEDELVLIDKDGNKIALNQQQIEYLQGLKMLESAENEPENQPDYAELERMNPYDLAALRRLGELEAEEDMAGLYNSTPGTGKKLYPFHYHQNSEDYKNLGNMHRENRTIQYYPQDQKPQFSSKPVIFSNRSTTYDAEDPRATMSGSKQTNALQQQSDRQWLKRDPMTETAQTVSSGFPQTTNQDFHNGEPFEKATYLKGGMNKSNYKKSTSYNAYVNAMFNSGVFVNPGHDQV